MNASTLLATAAHAMNEAMAATPSEAGTWYTRAATCATKAAERVERSTQ